MPRTSQASTGKLTGPCRLCTAKRSTSWRRIPAAAGDAAGLTACNPCYVYIAKQVRDDPEGIPEALDACRAAKRVRLTPQEGKEEDEGIEQEEDEEEEGEEAGSPGCDAGSIGGGFMDLLLHTSSSTAAARAAAAAARAAAAVATGTAGSSPAPEDSLVLAGGSSSAAAAAGQLGSATPQCRGGQLQGLPLAARLGLAEQQGPRRPTRKSRQRSPSPPPRLARASSGLKQTQLLPQLAQQAASQQQTQQRRRQQQQQQGQSPVVQLPAQLGSVPYSPLVASAMHGGSDGGARLRALRDACCRLFGDSEVALLAMRRAYFSATGQLPGASPELLAPMPCVWLLLPGAGRQPQPASAMLLSVRLPPHGLNDDAQMLLLGAGMGLETATRLVVYCPQTGQLLQWREWVQQDEHALYLHPRYRVPTWDSSEAWKLLFPDPASDTTQARLLSGVIETFGCQPRLTAAAPSFTVGNGGGERLATVGSSSLAETATLMHSQAASTAAAAAAAAAVTHMATPLQPPQLPPLQLELPSPQQQLQQRKPSAVPQQTAGEWAACQMGESHSASKPLAWHGALQQAERGAGRQQQQQQQHASPTAISPLLSLAQHAPDQVPAPGHNPSSVPQQFGSLDLPRQWPVHTGPTASQPPSSSAQPAAPSSWRRTAEALQQQQQQQHQQQQQVQQQQLFQAQQEHQQRRLFQAHQAQQQQQQLVQAHALEMQRLASQRRSGSLVDSLMHPAEALLHSGLLTPSDLELSDSEMLELIDCLGSGSGSDFLL